MYKENIWTSSFEFHSLRNAVMDYFCDRDFKGISYSSKAFPEYPEKC
jgi:hypothetical protein